MRGLLVIIIICTFTSIYAQEKGPLGIAPFILEESKEGYISPEEAKEIEASRKTWFEKQMAILSLTEKKSIFHEKSVANVYKRIKDQMEWNKNYTLQRFLEVAKKTEEIGYTVSSYGEHLILQKDGSYIRYYNGRPTDIFNLIERDNYGNYHIINIMNIYYEEGDEFVVNYDTTSTHVMEYIKLEYDPIGAINYIKFDDAEYLANLPDRPSKYTITEGSVEKTPELKLDTPTDTETAKALYNRIVGSIIPAIESALVYKVTTAFSNIKYYTLAEDTATKDTPGGVYGEKLSYDYTIKSTDAPDAPETGTVSNIRYYLLDKIYIEPLDELWWHAQNASLINLHHDKEPKEASSHTVATKLGITREIDFYDAHYDSYNSLSSYREVYKIDGTEVGRYYYHDISRDSYRRQIGYTVEGDTYGLSFTRTYSNIGYDVLSRITSYNMSETIDGTTTDYRWWDMTYNNLWQLTDYYYSVNGVEHHRLLITYNSYGLVSSFVDVSIEDGITTTIYRHNTYNSNGLLTGYTEYKLRQSDTVHEFYYIWVGNITYNSIYAITGFDSLTIKDTYATTITDYGDRIRTIIDAMVFNGVSYTLSTIDMIALGFNSAQFTIITEKWRNLQYYSVGESVGSNYYNLTLDTFRGRLKSYSKVIRTTTTSSDTAEQTTL